MPQTMSNTEVEKGRRTQVSFCRTMMQQILELLWLAKSTSWGEAMLSSEKIRPVAIAIIKLRLSGDISNYSQLVIQSIKTSLY